MDEKKIIQTVNHLISNCGNLKDIEKLTIVYDHTTKDIAEVFFNQAKLISEQVNFIETPLANRHGEEPSDIAKESMLESDLIISLCKFSLAHSSARIEAAKQGARFLSLPLYSWSLLEDRSTQVDYKGQAPIVRKITDALTNGKRVKVKSSIGTDILLDISARIANYCPGFVINPGDLGSPPDIESNISPQENQSNGIVVVDGSITTPEIGLLKSLVMLEVKNGRVTQITSENSSYVDILETIFEDHDSKRRILAECGIGLNPEAKLTGSMLTDEGSFGCVHFGFGSNYTLGGQNKVDFHLDFVFKEATLIIDDVIYLENGHLIK